MSEGKMTRGCAKGARGTHAGGRSDGQIAEAHRVAAAMVAAAYDRAERAGLCASCAGDEIIRVAVSGMLERGVGETDAMRVVLGAIGRLLRVHMSIEVDYVGEEALPCTYTAAPAAGCPSYSGTA